MLPNDVERAQHGVDAGFFSAVCMKGGPEKWLSTKLLGSRSAMVACGWPICTIMESSFL